MKPLIATTILVNHGLLMSERENARNRQTVLGREPNLQITAEGHKQSAKPGKRLGRQKLSSACDHQQIMKLLKQSFGVPFFVPQVLPFCPPDLPLHTILMKTVE